jgi:pSer/pThr/pTyr-binding forkhead associated (FHA) protein
MGHALLKIRSGSQSGKAFPLLRPEIVIGRSKECDIRPEDRERLSRKHARIRWDGTAFVVEDLGSLNGTRVDGEPVRSRRLRTGQVIALGDFAAELWVPPEGPEFVPAPNKHSRSGDPQARLAPRTGAALAFVVAGVAVVLAVGVGQFPRPNRSAAARAGSSQADGTTQGSASTPAGKTPDEPAHGGTSAAPKGVPAGLVGLTPEIQQKVEAATVWITTKPTPDATIGAHATGFCALAPSLIVTCRHVVLFTPEELGAEGGDRSPATAGTSAVPAGEIDLVLHSRTEREKVIAGELVWVDPDRDLALIRMKEDRLEPLPLSDAERLIKTETCWAIGYPGVETRDIGSSPPEVSMQRMEFQTPRHDDSGHLARLQFGGTVTHGNSGGPIITPDGAVVGVVWRAARELQAQDPQQAAGISYAIPSNFVREMAEKASGDAPGRE